MHYQRGGRIDVLLKLILCNHNFVFFFFLSPGRAAQPSPRGRNEAYTSLYTCGASHRHVERVKSARVYPASVSIRRTPSSKDGGDTLSLTWASRAQGKPPRYVQSYACMCVCIVSRRGISKPPVVCSGSLYKSANPHLLFTSRRIIETRKR